MYLFGSQAKKGKDFLEGKEIEAEPHSDLDIAVLAEKTSENTIKLYGELYRELSYLFEPFDIDLVFMHEHNALFRFEIIKGYRVFAEDEEFADMYEELTMKEAADLAFKQKGFLEDIIEAIEDGYITIEYSPYHRTS